HLAALTELRLSGNNIGSGGASALAGAPHLTGLERLGLEENGLTPPAVRELLLSPSLARVTELILNNLGNAGEPGAKPNAVGDALEALPGSPFQAAFRTLGLARTGIDAGGVAALAASPRCAGLRGLDLSENLLAGPEALRALAQSPHLA